MDRTNQKILIVDDNEDIVTLVAGGLKSLGCTNVMEFSDSEKAMQHLLQSDVDTLITDLCMPNIDGLELAIAAHKKEIPRIIVMSGTPKQEALEKLSELGAHFFQKPCLLGGLFDRVMANDSDYHSLKAI